jgi:nitrogen regulatory protein PII
MQHFTKNQEITMYHIVVLVLHNVDSCNNILNAWEDAGIRGVTILESSGLGRIRQAGLLDDLPLFPSMHDLVRSSETSNRTFFTIVKSQEKIDAIVKATESCVGDLEDPDTGLLFVMPVSHVYGKSKLA